MTNTVEILKCGWEKKDFRRYVGYLRVFGEMGVLKGHAVYLKKNSTLKLSNIRQLFIEDCRGNLKNATIFKLFSHDPTFPDGAVVKNLLANAGEARDMASIPGKIP